MTSCTPSSCPTGVPAAGWAGGCLRRPFVGLLGGSTPADPTGAPCTATCTPTGAACALTRHEGNVRGRGGWL